MSDNKGLAVVQQQMKELDVLAGQTQYLPGLVTATREDDVARMRETLGEEAFTTAREAGRALPLQEAITEAIELADELMSGAKYCSSA